MKKFATISLILTLTLASIAMAKTLSKPQLTDLKKRPELREQMDKMILSMFDMDIMIHKTQTADYDILKEDAERILQAIQEIRAKDPDSILYKHLKNLEEPTSLLLKYAKKQDPRALKYPEQIFSACFQCHSVYRKNPLY